MMTRNASELATRLKLSLAVPDLKTDLGQKNPQSVKLSHFIGSDPKTWAAKASGAQAPYISAGHHLRIAKQSHFGPFL